jgi:hypothetical protein
MERDDELYGPLMKEFHRERRTLFHFLPTVAISDTVYDARVVSEICNLLFLQAFGFKGHTATSGA